jgi:hypothetical protein
LSFNPSQIWKLGCSLKARRYQRNHLSHRKYPPGFLNSGGYFVSIPLPGVVGESHSSLPLLAAIKFQSPCGVGGLKANWQNGEPVGRCCAVSIPLRGRWVERGHLETMAVNVVQVSIPLRGRWVESTLYNFRRWNFHKCFNPLAG